MRTATLLMAISLPACSAAEYMAPRARHPQVLSHRGASGYVPEHSYNAYQLAIDLGTDYIEPDLVVTKEGRFVAMHDLLLDDTTDVASHPEFADRKTTKSVDGINTTGFYVIDFTFEELQTLTLKQRMSGRTDLYDGYFRIPTFEDIMELVQTHYISTNFTIGLYIELKHPSFHLEHGFNTADMLLSQLSMGGYLTAGEAVPSDLEQVVPVVIQCFERDTLVYLKERTSIPLIYLLNIATAALYWSPEGLSDIASFAGGVGPQKEFFQGDSARAVSNVEMAHEAGLKLHPWTFRLDSGVGTQFRGDFRAEQEYYLCCLKMDALFTEFPDRTREVIDSYLTYENSSECSTSCSY